MLPAGSGANIHALLGFARLASFMGSLKRGITQLKRHAVFASIFVGMIALGLRLLLLTVIPPPRPAGPDEFSYLLAPDTFSHGPH
jgi:hypothetical protein